MWIKTIDGRLATLSAPPSSGQSVRNDTVYTYFDNGWTRTSGDPWDIITTYDYNELGAQTLRRLTSAGGSSERVMTWQYHPDGKLKARADEGVPVGRQVVLVDNSDAHNVATTGTWVTDGTAADRYGPDYATHAAGTGTNVFTWKLNVPQAGTYQVFTRYPQVSGAAVDAEYTVAPAGGSTVAAVDQTGNSGEWVSLGSFAFDEGNTHTISLSDQAGGIVVGDAVKLVRDNTGETDAEKQDYTYIYDPNGNLTGIGDASPDARVDTYTVTYTGLNQVERVTEQRDGQVVNTTVFGYDENGVPKTVQHDKQCSAFDYDVRNMLATVTVGTTASDLDPKVTTYTYSDRGERAHEVKGNGNTVDYTYFLDGLLKSQVEKKSNGTLVSEYTMGYDLNGNRIHEVTSKMNADDHAALLASTIDYGYDPRDRISGKTTTGDGAGSETYVHDANGNVISQTVKGATTAFSYDRNRLTSASTAGTTATYNYDPFGRLDTITAGGTIIERNVYDGFDHVVENRKNSGGTTAVTRYTFDPLDRTNSKTSDAGTAKEKTTNFNYLGLSGEVLDEDVAGTITKSYQYSPWGQRLSQVTHNGDGTTEDAYYGYNPHTDVETLTDEAGDTKATYGYTAYGSNDTTQFTGIDKPDTADPTKEPYNAYRFNAKRWDQASGTYDMGFRDYNPGLNRFLTRDTYNGALADLNLGLNPWTGNRYAFGGGNPIGNIEIDGHVWVNDGGRGFPVVGGTSGVPSPTPAPTPGDPNPQSPSATPSATPWGDGGAYKDDWARRDNEMCSQKLVRELCTKAERRLSAELFSWLPWIGVPASGYLAKDAADRGEYIGAGLEILGVVPLAKLGKVGKRLPTGGKLNKLVGDAYRDHVADFFRQMGKRVVTDADDAKALTFKTPYGDRRFDIAVFDDNDNLLGYIETKSGSEKTKAEQVKKDEWLREAYGLTIDYVYDDMLNLLY